MYRPLALIMAAVLSHILVVAHDNAWGAEALPFKPKTTLVSESLATNANLPIVTVEIDGKQCRFLVCTTDVFTQLDKSLSVKLKPFRLKRSETPAQLLHMVESPKIRLGNFKVDWLAFVEPIDCRHLAMENGEQIHGILGMDVLQELVLQIDPDNGVLRIAAPDLSDMPPGLHFPIQFDRDFVPRLSCTIAPGHSKSFAIATADYSNGSIDRASAEYVAKNGGEIVKEKIVVMTPLGAGDKLDVVTIPQIDCGNVKLSQQKFTVEDDHRLGMYSLLRLNVTFDFKNRRVYCLPSRLNISGDRRSQLGVTFNLEKQYLRVSQLDKGLAADAGLQRGDRILAVNGFSVESQFGKAYHSLFFPAASATLIEVERSSRKLSFKLPK